VTGIAATTPLLSSEYNLRSQFEWLADGSLDFLIEENLVLEIGLLHEYLLDLGNMEIEDIISKGEEKGKNMYPDSGDTFKWISILRAADSLWSTSDECGFIRLAEEGIRGVCPQILATGWNRSVCTVHKEQQLELTLTQK
jgi:hypothetical protein